MHPFIEKAKNEGQNSNIEYLKLLLDDEKNNGHTPTIYSIYHELARLELSTQTPADSVLSAENYRKSIEYIYTREDCFDFILPAFIVMMSRYPKSASISEEVADESKKMILGCKYWIDEGGWEKKPCYFTENHQILFHSNEYMAGQLYKDEIFTNNKKNGRWHMEHARPFILRWLDWRFRFGFSEWLSNTYYHEDLLALTPLMFLCEDEEIRTKARMVADLLFFDMALNCYKGVFGSTHGRTYSQYICKTDDVSTVLRGLFLAIGEQPLMLSATAVLLAIMDYKVAAPIADIALDTATIENRQSMSLTPEEGKSFGVDPKSFDNLNFYWGMEAFSHRLVVDNTLKVQAVPGYYLLERARAYKENFDLCDAAGVQTEADPDYTSMPKVDIYTYKTADYMLSCAQNYKKGRFGFQQHIWQASLGGKALVYTNHPGTEEYTARPNMWAGNRILPKALAYKNVQLCLYNTPVSMVPAFSHETHAYFPQEFMDEVAEKNGWYFGRKDNGYVAIRPLSGYVRWEDPDPAYYSNMGIEPKDSDGNDVVVKSISAAAWWYDDGKNVVIKPYELLATGRSNVWVCELGSLSEYGDFQAFVETIAKAEIKGDVFNFTYVSPSQGEMKTGWNLPFTVKGNEIETNDYPRFDNPFCRAERAARKLEIQTPKNKLSLDFEGCHRK